MAQIEYGPLAAFESLAAAQLLAKVFSAAEPPAVAVGLSSAELERFVALLCPKAVTDGLTIVAREAGSQRIVGVLLTDDFAAPLAVDLEQISSKFRAIFALLECLDKQYRSGRQIEIGQCLHLFMLAVDEKFAGMGIAQTLVTACLASGARKGYMHAVTEATGVISQHVFQKLGFVVRARVRYQDYRYEGYPVFSSILQHEAAALMDLAIT